MKQQSKSSAHKKVTTRKIIWILIFLIGILTGMVFSFWSNPLKRNANALRDNILALGVEHGAAVKLSELTPFAWDMVYAFEPYTTKAEMEEILGFASGALEESVSEGMQTIVFTKDDKVVCCICDYPYKLGYLLDLGRLEQPKRRFMRLYSEVDDTLTVLHHLNFVLLQYQGYVFEGMITELAGDLALVQIDDGYPIRSSGDQVYVYLNEELQKEAVAGDRVRVRYDGMVQETYPMQLAGLMGVELLETEVSEVLESSESVSGQSSAGQEAKAAPSDTAAQIDETQVDMSMQEALSEESLDQEPIFFEKDNKQYQKVPDLIDGEYHWANAVSEGTMKLDSHGHEHVDYNSQTRWFESLEDDRAIQVRRWDNLRYSAGKYLIYDYDGVVHVAKADDIHHPVLSYDRDGTHGNILRIPDGYMVADERNYTITFYDENFRRTKEITGYRAGENGRYYCDGLLAIRDMETGYCGFMDQAGEIVIPCQYGLVSDFKNGYASVLADAALEPYTEDGGTVKMFDAVSGNWGILNTKGSYVVEPSERYGLMESENPDADFYCGVTRFSEVREDGSVDFMRVDGEQKILETLYLR